MSIVQTIVGSVRITENLSVGGATGTAVIADLGKISMLVDING